MKNETKFHRGNGECVVPEVTSRRENEGLRYVTQDRFDLHVSRQPVVAYCDHKEPIGWLQGYQERYEIEYSRHPDEPTYWVKCSKEDYETCNKVGVDCRIFLVKKGDEPTGETKEEIHNNVMEHLKMVKFLAALAKGNKIFIQCAPTDTGAKQFPNSNFAIKELDLPNFKENNSAQKDEQDELPPLDSVEPIELDVWYLGHRSEERIVSDIMNALGDNVANILISPSKQRGERELERFGTLFETMDKSIRCLYLEIPHAVARDIESVWQEIKRMFEISQPQSKEQ